MKFFTRLYRRLRNKCVVCGRPLSKITRIFRNKIWYCSFTCAGYDETFAINLAHPNNKRKPSLFRGTVQNYKEF